MQVQTQDTPRPTVERLAAVCRRTGLSRSTIYRRLDADPDFPRPVQLGTGARAVGFLTSEIDAWLAGRIAARDQQAGTK